MNTPEAVPPTRVALKSQWRPQEPPQEQHRPGTQTGRTNPPAQGTTLDHDVESAALQTPLVGEAGVEVRPNPHASNPKQDDFVAGIVVDWREAHPEHRTTFIACGYAGDPAGARAAAQTAWSRCTDGAPGGPGDVAREAMTRLEQRRTLETAGARSPGVIADETLALEDFVGPTLHGRLENVKHRLTHYLPDAVRSGMSPERLQQTVRNTAARKTKVVADAVQLWRDLALHAPDTLGARLKTFLETEPASPATQAAREAVATDVAPRTLDDRKARLCEALERTPPGATGADVAELCEEAGRLHGAAVACGRDDVRRDIETLMQPRGLARHLPTHPDAGAAKPLLDRWMEKAETVMDRHAFGTEHQPKQVACVLETLAKYYNAARAGGRTDLVGRMNTLMKTYSLYPANEHEEPTVFRKAPADNALFRLARRLAPNVVDPDMRAETRAFDAARATALTRDAGAARDATRDR